MQINEIRRVFPDVSHGRTLVETIHDETSGNFRTALTAVALGPVDSEAYWVHKSTKGAGTRESLLTEGIFGRSAQEMARMKEVYMEVYSKNMERVVSGDLSLKTEKLFELGMKGRWDDHQRAPDGKITSDVKALYSALERFGTDQVTVSEIFARSSPSHLRDVCIAYQSANGTNLRDVINKKFMNHMVCNYLPISCFIHLRYQLSLCYCVISFSMLTNLFAMLTNRKMHSYTSSTAPWTLLVATLVFLKNR